jgi:cytoskeletal protein CcmA (bactofilin family)
MFNHRKADAAHAPAASNEVEISAVRPPSISGPIHSTGSRGDATAHSVVDACLTMKGDLESDGDILVKGKVIGNIRCKLLIIEVDALVEGGVDAEEVVVRGNTKGTLQADKVRLERTANVSSEIYHRTFSAEEGARIKGTLQCKDEGPAGRAHNREAKTSAGTKAVGRPKEQALNGQSEAAEADAA